MSTYAAEQASILLGRFVFRASRVAKLADADSVHNLRVAIRRLSQCLRAFGPFFPAGECRKVRRRLRRMRQGVMINWNHS